MEDEKLDEYVVTRTADSWSGFRYKITGPPMIRLGLGYSDVPWVAWSWTLRGAKWRIRRQKARVARTNKVIYREAA